MNSPSTLEILIGALDSADDRLDDEPRPEPPDYEYDTDPTYCGDANCFAHARENDYVG